MMWQTPPQAQTAGQRFTVDGSPALEERIAELCAGVRREITRILPARELQAILLGGGYGRGEGGVRHTPEGDEPYNDLEFYVCVCEPRLLQERRWGGMVHQLAGRLTAEAGLEIELKLITLTQLRRSPVTMFYHDLVMGHRWVLGDERLLAGCHHHRQAAEIPLAEATRLLMNRCSGLLFARALLERDGLGPEEAEFVERNVAKAQLGLGDAVLAAGGQYHWSCRERGRRVEKLSGPWPWLPQVRAHHREGVEFKLHPHQDSKEDELRARHAEVTELALRVWLWLESLRLGQPFTCARDYALSRIDKCPETEAWRNWMINLGKVGWQAALGLDGWRYPRERVLEALALLLWEPGVTRDTGLLRYVQHRLRTPARSWSELVDAYKQLWCRFN